MLNKWKLIALCALLLILGDIRNSSSSSGGSKSGSSKMWLAFSSFAELAFLLF